MGGGATGAGLGCSTGAGGLTAGRGSSSTTVSLTGAFLDGPQPIKYWQVVRADLVGFKKYKVLFICFSFDLIMINKMINRVVLIHSNEHVISKYHFI